MMPLRLDGFTGFAIWITLMLSLSIMLSTVQVPQYVL